MSKNLALFLFVAVSAGAVMWRFDSNSRRRVASGFEDSFGDKGLGEKAALLWTVVRWPGPRLAPEGVLYVLRYISVPTENGPVGLVPGVQVRVVRETGATVTATVPAMASAREIELAAVDLTDDLDLLSRVRKDDEAAHRALQAKLAADTAEHERSLARTNAQTAVAADAARARIAAVPAAGIGARMTPLQQPVTPAHGYSYYSGGYGYAPAVVVTAPPTDAGDSRRAASPAAGAQGGRSFAEPASAAFGPRPTYTTLKPGASSSSPTATTGEARPGQGLRPR